MAGVTESVVEQTGLAWLEALGYAVLHGAAVPAGEPAAERSETDCGWLDPAHSTE